MAGIEGRPCGPWKQRRVEHEIGFVDERHPRTLLGQDALERTCGIEAAETSAGDDDLEGHEDRIGCGK